MTRIFLLALLLALNGCSLVAVTVQQAPPATPTAGLVVVGWNVIPAADGATVMLDVENRGTATETVTLADASLEDDAGTTYIAGNVGVMMLRPGQRGPVELRVALAPGRTLVRARVAGMTVGLTEAKP